MITRQQLYHCIRAPLLYYLYFAKQIIVASYDIEQRVTEVFF
jgi:hypothetical protein